MPGKKRRGPRPLPGVCYSVVVLLLIKYKMTMAAMIGANVNKRESLDAGMKNLVQVGKTWYKYEPIFVFHKK